VVEQQSWYLDADGLDKFSHHLLVKKNEILKGYLRLTPPGKKYKVPSIGRIAVQEEMRGNNFGHEIVNEGLIKSNTIYNSAESRISAQQYLIKFYEKHGFEVEGGIYDEDGIPHVQMVKNG
jgi:ElaA protein